MEQKDPLLKQELAEAMVCAFASGAVACLGGGGPRPVGAGGAYSVQAGLTPDPIVRCAMGTWFGFISSPLVPSPVGSPRVCSWPRSLVGPRGRESLAAAALRAAPGSGFLAGPAG